MKKRMSLTLLTMILLLGALSHAHAYDATGEWSVSVSNQWNNCGDPNDPDYTTTGTIVQNGNVFSIDVLGVNASGGTVVGNNYTISGQFPEEGGTTQETLNFELTNETTGSGTASWTWSDGLFFTCQGGGQFTMNKVVLPEPVESAPSDFNSDATSDVLFQHDSDGRLLIWAMNNFSRTVKLPQSLASSWDVVGKGDFNADGTTDVLYMKDDGSTAIAEMSNAARSSLAFPGGIKPVWSVQGVGDFNGDGTDDILWRRSTDGVTMIWGIVDSARDKMSWPGGLAFFWDIVGVGDFDNDGIDDILCQHNSDGRLLIWKMNNYGRAAVKLPQSLSNAWTVMGVGDFNADGTDDVLYRKDTGDTAIAEFSSLKRNALEFPGGINFVWDIKDVGDYDGDGNDDIFFQRDSDKMTLIWGVVDSARTKVAWPGGLVAQWVVK